MEDFDPSRRCGRQRCRKRVREITRKLLPRFVACSQAAAALHAKGATTSFDRRLPLLRLPLCSPSPLDPPSRHLLPHCTAPSAHALHNRTFGTAQRGWNSIIIISRMRRSEMPVVQLVQEKSHKTSPLPGKESKCFTCKLQFVFGILFVSNFKVLKTGLRAR